MSGADLLVHKNYDQRCVFADERDKQSAIAFDRWNFPSVTAGLAKYLSPGKRAGRRGDTRQSDNSWARGEKNGG